MKTVSLELSKQLKEAGYPQNTYFRWQRAYHVSESFDKGVSLGKEWVWHDEYELVQTPSKITTANIKWYQSYLNELDETAFASPTADEILEQLPEALKPNESYERACDFWYQKIVGKWTVTWELLPRHRGSIIAHFQADSLADAAAKMWLYLKKEGLL